MPGSIRLINVNGLSAIVDINTTGTPTEFSAFSDPACTQSVSLPATVTADTTFYVQATGAVVLSVVVDSQELAGPATVFLSDAGPVTFSLDTDPRNSESGVLLGLVSTHASGGSSAGAPVVRKFPFAFDTSGLLTGHAVYTPTIGDVLLDAWVQINTAWNGSTPTFDFGSFISTSGLLRALVGPGGPIPLDHADTAQFSNDGVLVGISTDAATLNNISSAAFMLQVDGAGPNLTLRGNPWQVQGQRSFPAVFTTADPLKICVSDDGQIAPDGADPGSTQGAAILYLVTATPA